MPAAVASAQEDSILRVALGEIPPEPLQKSTPGAPRWRLLWMFDEDDAQCAIADLVFPTKTRGLMCGLVVRKERIRETVWTTSDGGATWRESKVNETPLSLFALDESRVWYVGEKNLWFSPESGLQWTKVGRLPEKTTRVHFLDSSRGWAYGAGKVIHRTDTGGRKWSPVPESQKLSVTDSYTEFAWMTFLNPEIGIAIGSSKRPKDDDSFLPDWMVPERASKRKLTPGTIVMLETRDGGATWKPSLKSVFGGVLRLRAAGALGLSLVRYGDSFQWPSEVYELSLATGSSEPIFRKKGYNVTDLYPTKTGAILAAMQPPGLMLGSPIPGKLKMLYSADRHVWTECKVDYRAEGRHAVMAVVDEQTAWVATDTGQVLKMVTD